MVSRKRILITGASGYIGGHLARSLLSSGFEVRCLVRPTSQVAGLRELGVELVHNDLDQPQDLRRVVAGCDVVYHVAGRTSARRRDELYRTNCRGSGAIARACARQLTPPCLILVSSLAAAGTSAAGRLRTERDRAAPVSEYGRSKRAGERAAIAWADQLPISVVRPGIVFGEGNREMLPIFRSIARLHLHFVPGYSPRRVGLVHHEDLIEILRRVEATGQRVQKFATAGGRAGRAFEEAGDRSGFYFAVAPEFPTYPQLGRMIAAAVGSARTMVVHLPEPLAWLAAAGNQGINYLRVRADSFNIDKMREAFAGDWVGSTARIEQELGFQPPTSLQARLNQTARWYQAHGWL